MIFRSLSIMNDKISSRLSLALLELSLMFGMLFTLGVPARVSPVTAWGDLPILLMLRGSIWLFGLSILPGLFLLRLTRISERLQGLERIVIAIHLSIAAIGVLTLVVFYIERNITDLPFISISALLFLFAASSLECSARKCVPSIRPTQGQIALVLLMMSAITISFFVQFAFRYSIPGDNWVVIKPAVQIIDSRNVYEEFKEFSYPMMFSFILGGLSVSSGLPVLNTYVALFPLSLLNMLSFYVMMRALFNADEKIAAISTFIYGFGGGLAWLIQYFTYNNQMNFMYLGMFTGDIYGFIFFWNDIMFSYKSFATTLAYTSVIAYSLAMRFDDNTRKTLLLVISSLFMLFSYMVHMMEPIFLIPILLVLSHIHKKWRNLGILVGISVFLMLMIDYLMSGFTLWLSIKKIQGFTYYVSVDRMVMYAAPLLGAVLLMTAARRYSSRSLHGFKKILQLREHMRQVRFLVVITLLALYIVGLVIYLSTSPPWTDVSFPWYVNPIRYGFVGMLAILGLGVVDWNDSRFKVIAFWCLFPVLIGSLWWTGRMNAYLFPMLAFLAALAIDWIWRSSRLSLQITYVSRGVRKRRIRANIKPAVSVLLLVMLALSSSSVIYGAAEYSKLGSPIEADDEMRVLEWINRNISKNFTVLVPTKYTTSRGVNTISDRQVYENSRIGPMVNASAFKDMTRTLALRNISYAVSAEDSDSSPLSLQLLSHSTQVFSSGGTRVYRLSHFNLPSPEYSIAIIDKQTLGLREAKHLGWMDDNFVEGWSSSNIDFNSDGEILTLSWSFSPDSSSIPAIGKTMNQAVNTSEFQYFVARYKNVAETTLAGLKSIGQIVTLTNQTGYPKGYITNIMLPVHVSDEFQTIIVGLPKNQEVASLGLWMRNYNRLNGTLTLKIDYMAFASESALSQFDDLRYLTMTVPALWPEKYCIFSDSRGISNSSVICQAYDDSSLENLRLSNARTFILFNASASFPAWGEGWQKDGNDVIQGYLDGKKVFIVGIESALNRYGDLEDTSSSIYTMLNPLWH